MQTIVCAYTNYYFLRKKAITYLKWQWWFMYFCEIKFIVKTKIMIVDTLENASRYYMLHPSMEQAFDFLESLTADEFPEEKTELIGEHLFGNGMVRDTKDFGDSIWESHEKYLDIHFLVEGDEKIFYADEADMTETEAYNPEKDITVFEGNGAEVFCPQNGFVIFFPGEIHKALVHGLQPNKVKKMVIKLGVE